MYPNLKAELAKRNMTQAELAYKIGVTKSTISLKLLGKAPISIDEAFAIKEAVHSRLSLDVLFARDAV